MFIIIYDNRSNSNRSAFINYILELNEVYYNEETEKINFNNINSRPALIFELLVKAIDADVNCLGSQAPMNFLYPTFRFSLCWNF